ncbi:MAG: 1-acyl-sn-glycerol-3-phosphate acyltransferase [Clostridia bacterium]|nr:1-acyl-sn-glycerol-3-phosphate acyltransferase [Clostridia bacterium]
MKKRAPHEVLKDYTPEIPGKGISFLMRALIFFMNAPAPAKFVYNYDKKALKGKPVLIIAAHASRDDYKYVIHGYRQANPNIITGYHSMLKPGLFQIMMKCGVIPKTLYEPCPSAVKSILRLKKEGASFLLFPEGIQSMCGREHPLRPDTGKLVKKLGLDVVVATSRGAYLSCPRYNPKSARGKIVYTFDHVFTPEDLKDLDSAEIERVLSNKLTYNDFISNEKPRYRYRHAHGNASGLDNLLIVCPLCKKEFTMKTEGREIVCECGSRVRIGDDYSLTPSVTISEFPFARLDEWYDFQCEFIKNEALKEGFRLSYECNHNTFDMASGSKTMKRRLGSGTLTLTREGLTYKGDDKETAYPPYSAPPSSRDSDTLQDGVNLFFPIEKVPSAPFIGGRGNEFYFENCYHEFIITDDRRKAVKMLTAVESLYERKQNDKLNSI